MKPSNIVGYVIESRQHGLMKWDAKDGTLYTAGYKPTLFWSRQDARNHAKRAARWWAHFSEKWEPYVPDYGDYRVRAVASL